MAKIAATGSDGVTKDMAKTLRAKANGLVLNKAAKQALDKL